MTQRPLRATGTDQHEALHIHGTTLIPGLGTTPLQLLELLLNWPGDLAEHYAPHLRAQRPRPWRASPR